jgi:hypothetical protein
MTPETKQTIKDRFNAAVAGSPYADEVIEGIVTHEGKDVTRRTLVNLTLQSEQFFEQVDKLLATGKVSLDQFIEKFEDGMKKSIHSGPRP